MGITFFNFWKTLHEDNTSIPIFYYGFRSSKHDNHETLNVGVTIFGLGFNLWIQYSV